MAKTVIPNMASETAIPQQAAFADMIQPVHRTRSAHLASAIAGTLPRG